MGSFQLYLGKNVALYLKFSPRSAAKEASVKPTLVASEFNTDPSDTLCDCNSNILRKCKKLETQQVNTALASQSRHTVCVRHVSTFFLHDFGRIRNWQKTLSPLQPTGKMENS